MTSDEQALLAYAQRNIDGAAKDVAAIGDSMMVLLRLCEMKLTGYLATRNGAGEHALSTLCSDISSFVVCIRRLGNVSAELVASAMRHAKSISASVSPTEPDEEGELLLQACHRAVLKLNNLSASIEAVDSGASDCLSKLAVVVDNSLLRQEAVSEFSKLLDRLLAR